MKRLVFFLTLILATDISIGQYDQSQYQSQYQQQQRQYQQQQYQQQQYQQYQQYPQRNNYNQRRVHPNQYYPGRVVTRTQTGRVRAKPRYNRVDPSEYLRIMKGSQEGSQVVYPKQRVVYPKYQRTHYKQPVQQQTYYPYYKKYVQVFQKPVNVYKPPTYKPKWPKLQGRCQTVPDISIDGKNPVKEQCSQGRAVLVFLMKRRCDFCYHQLKELNKLAKHYKDTGKPLSVIAINHKNAPLSPAIKRQFPHLKIYEEPADKDIFGRLGGDWRETILYDVCCRKQYLYGYPFNWMGYNILRHAIFNTLYYDQVICGVCKRATQAPVNTTMAATTVEP